MNMRKDSGEGFAIGAFAIWALLVLSFNVAIVWVVLHFVAKYW